MYLFGGQTGKKNKMGDFDEESALEGDVEEKKRQAEQRIKGKPFRQQTRAANGEGRTIINQKRLPTHGRTDKG